MTGRTVTVTASSTRAPSASEALNTTISSPDQSHGANMFTQWSVVMLTQMCSNPDAKYRMSWSGSMKWSSRSNAFSRTSPWYIVTSGRSSVRIGTLSSETVTQTMVALDSSPSLTVTTTMAVYPLKLSG